MTLDELERLEREASQLRWIHHGYQIITSEEPGVPWAHQWLVAETASTDEPSGFPDARLICAMRNALPALLRLARGVAEEHAAALAVNEAKEGAELHAALTRHSMAHRAVVAALAALGGGNL